MIRRAAVCAALLLLGSVACDEGSERPSARAPGPTRIPHERKEPEADKRRRKPAERKASRPNDAAVRNLALTPADRRRVDRAVSDLKDLGLWKRLTRPVEMVVIATRPGAERTPADGHLADAVRNVQVGRRPGYVCDVMIYSQALADDVVRQGIYYDQGRLSAPPPTLRQFWAVILAHEIAHCSDAGQRGEAHSSRWERRVLERFGATRLGTL